MYFVERIEPSRYSIKGEGVEVSATCYEPFSSYSEVKRVEGKGSRKIKDMLPKLIRNFVRQEDESKRLELKHRGEDFKRNFIAACKADYKVWQSIDNRKLYKAVLNYGYTGHGHRDETATSEKEMTGQHLKMHINYSNVLSYEQIEIRNTDLFVLGSGRDYERHAAEDQRIIISMNTTYVTGLAMKEMLSLGTSFHGHKNRTSNEVVIEYAQKFANGQVLSISSMMSRTTKEDQRIASNHYERLMSELNRASKVPEEKEIFNTTEEMTIEVFTVYDSCYFGETYGSVGDAVMDKTADIPIEKGDYVEGFYSGLFLEISGNLYNLYHPTKNHGNPRKAGR